MSASAPAPSTSRLGRHCTHCGALLDGLSQRRGLVHCEAAACRQAEEAAKLKVRWQRLGALAQQQAQALQAHADGAPALLLRLEATERELVPVTPALRERLAASWRQRAAESWRYPYPGTDSAERMPAGAGVLCVQCGGRCCAHGGVHDAFIDIDVLQRWQADHPGASLDDAVVGYLAQLPERHLKHACGFQGEAGCVLPRERRADVCNRYACPPLETLADHLGENRSAAAVVLTAKGARLERAALLQHGHLTPLPGLPQPAELPPTTP